MFSNEAPYFAWAGVNLGDDTSRLVTQTMRRLASKVKPKTLKFWGRVLAREQDYYVIQGTVNPFSADILPEGMEKVGEGVNTFTYWVATDRNIH